MAKELALQNASASRPPGAEHSALNLAILAGQSEVTFRVMFRVRNWVRVGFRVRVRVRVSA